MVLKKPYSKPSISLIRLDNSITLMMLSNPDPRGGGGSKGGSNDNNNKPFASPFGDKPFG